MGFLSNLFSSDNNGKVEHLKKLIENYNQNIKIEKFNMARHRAAKSPEHYQVGGRQKIEHFKRLIITSKEDIARLKRK